MNGRVVFVGIMLILATVIAIFSFPELQTAAKCQLLYLASTPSCQDAIKSSQQTAMILNITGIVGFVIIIAGVFVF